MLFYNISILSHSPKSAPLGCCATKASWSPAESEDSSLACATPKMVVLQARAESCTHVAPKT